MRKLIVFNLMSLDGYVAGPGGNVMVLPLDASFDAYCAERLDTAAIQEWQRPASSPADGRKRVTGAPCGNGLRQRSRRGSHQAAESHPGAIRRCGRSSRRVHCQP